MAGLAAARSLMQMGHGVVVVEGRDRAGGRVWTRRMCGVHPETGAALEAVGEMGGSILTGADGNPLSILARQLDLTWHTIRDTCPLYTEGGAPMDPSIDARVTREHEALLNRLGVEREAMDNDAAKNTASLGESLDRLWRERNLPPGLAPQTPAPNSSTATADWMGNGELASSDKSKASVDIAASATSAAETDMYHWYNANLEFANSAALATVSLGQWDQDDEYEFKGDHVFVPGGNGRLIAALARDVPVFYNHAVTEVTYEMDRERDGGKGEVYDKQAVIRGEAGDERREGGGGGASGSKENEPSRQVEVLCANGESFVADAVLVTVPLGVLKRGCIAFNPPLPSAKRQSIANLGFGVLNKVVLLFPHVFWDTGHDTFGYVNTRDASRRGRYFMFYNYAGISGGAVLVALVAGDAALEFETAGDAEGVAGAMAVLREIFTPQGVAVPDPVDSACVRWGSDPFAFGSYSSVSVDATGEDYDVLAEPVGAQLHFAGEATWRMHPATMHGAFLSGLREAARISDSLAGSGKGREATNASSGSGESDASLGINGGDDVGGSGGGSGGYREQNKKRDREANGEQTKDDAMAAIGDADTIHAKLQSVNTEPQIIHPEPIILDSKP